VGVSASSNGFLAKTARFVGKAAHAGVAPEQGINALNAATLALNALNAQRETFRDQDCVRVHPILTKAGDIVNIVPAEVRMETYVRARTSEAMLDAAAKVDRSLKAAAIAFGCTVEVETVPGYLPLANDEELAEVFRETTTALFGGDAYRELPHSGGSTDAGDLSQLMPVLHPVMTGARGIVHGKDWHIADTDDGYLAPAKTMAMMAVELLSGNAHKAKRVMDAFEPAMTKTDYLRQQQEIFRTDVHDGASLV
jgi:metal-dependent amidase/aminoacylase/carboxypeptidase family protein